jgi:23S rRNA (guanosine2251-2'-O)-methyltransferase
MEKIYGRHSVRAVVLTRPHAIRRVVLLDGKKPSINEEYLKILRPTNVQPEYLKWNDFLRETDLTKEEKHQGICIFVEQRTIYGEKELDKLQDAHVVLALDQISNPQNFATILRSAAFFGVDAVLLLRNRSTDLSPMVTRVAVGGAEFVQIYKVINLARSLEKLKTFGFWVYGLDERGEKTLAETDFGDKAVIVIGAEGEGLRQRTNKFCDMLVRIPGGRPGIESLNAGVATAVALSEIFRTPKVTP